MKTHRSTTLAVAVMLTLASGGLAAAQEAVPVSTTLGDSSRMLEVTTITGQTLTGITLVPARASAFRVAVRDTAGTVADPNYLLTGYQVESSLTNLYATDGTNYDYSRSIPSGEVTLGRAASPLDIRDALAHLDPEYLLASAQSIDCAAINAALGNDGLLSPLLTALTSPTCALLATLTGGALTFSDVPLDGMAYEDLDLSSLSAADLPLVPTGVPDHGQEYVSADCEATLGQNDDAGCPTVDRGTELTMLSANSASTFTTGLTTFLDGQIPDQLASADGTGAKASLDQVMYAMANSGTQSVADFANQLVLEFSETEQLAIVNDVLAATAPLGLDDLGGFGLLASAFPTLTVNPTTATTGTFAGTLTVRLIDCQACTQ